MALISIESLQKPVPANKFSLFELGFRPFFLAAAVAAVGLLALWSFLLSGGELAGDYFDKLLWHGHEMLFGFTVAVIAGFLLTAVRNWTGVATLRGRWLAALLSLWLLGRILPFMAAAVPGWLIAAIDLLFLPLLALAVLLPILRANKRPQLIFVGLLLLLAIANLLVHLELLGVTEQTAEQGLVLGLNGILLIIMIMAGRVMPFFIEKGAPGCKPKKIAWLEKLAIGLMLLLIVVELFWPSSWLVALLCLLLAGVHGWRLAGWHGRPLWSVPLLWVLYVGYGWLVLGFAIKGLEGGDILPQATALHAFAASIAILSLGMMARVSLGHTGRPLALMRGMRWSFIMLIMAMFARVMLPALMPELAAVIIAALGWMLAFSIFLVNYIPILVRARVDGQRG